LDFASYTSNPNVPQSNFYEKFTSARVIVGVGYQYYRMWWWVISHKTCFDNDFIGSHYSSSVTSSSVSSVASTVYTVSVDVPTSFSTQTAAATFPQKLGQFFIASASADEVTTLTAANFAVAIVDLAGTVLERVPLANSDISKNSDGSWSLTVPGKPRLDCIIVADVTKPIELAVNANINQDGFVFAPTTAESVDIDVGSTAAFKNFIEELGGSGTFESKSIDPQDTLQIKAVENLVNNIQVVVADQALTGYSNVSEALAAIKSTVTDTVKQEVENVKKPADGTAVTLIRDEGGLFWFEGNDFNEIAYGGISGTEEAIGYVFDGQKFVENTEEDPSNRLVLSSEGWVAASDKSKVSTFNEDGTVTLQDSSADGSKETAGVTQVFDLAGRNVSAYLAANYTTALLGKLANPETIFAAGAKGYRVKITNPVTTYWIFTQSGNEDGTCPWNPNLNASNTGGNCNLVMLYGAQDGSTAAPSGITALFSADVEPGATGFVGVNIPSESVNGMLVVQLLDNAAKTERFYLQSWTSGSLQLLGTGAWTDLTLPILKENARVVHIQIPKEIAAAVKNGTTTTSTNSSSKSATSDGNKSANSESAKSASSTKTANSEVAKSASSEGTKSATSDGNKSANSESAKSASSVKSASSANANTGKGEDAKSGSGKNELTDYYIVQQAGYLRQLYVEAEGVHTEDAAAVFNGEARTNILAALDYTRPPTLLPTATIEVNGNAADWADVVPAIVDPVGDQKGGNTSTDLTQVSIARSGDKIALLMKVAGNFAFPYAPDRDYSNYEVAIHFFSNVNCLGDSGGYVIANNFTSKAGDNTHKLDYYLNDSTTEPRDTTVASVEHVLETSFFFDYLPSNKGDYVALTAAIHSFVGSQAMDHDLSGKQSTCYKIR